MKYPLTAPLEVVDHDGRAYLTDANGWSIEIIVNQRTGIKEQPVVTKEERFEIANDLATAFNGYCCVAGTQKV